MTAPAPDIRQRIRTDIVEGRLAFGARITIDELAARYGVSHMPVREALRDLQGESLVVIEPNRGARVRPVDGAFIVNLFEMRSAIEIMLMRQAAKHCTAADIATLTAIQDALEAHIDRQDHAAVVAENHRFHRAINRIPANPEAQQLLDRHWTLMAALWRHYGYGEARFNGVASDHRHLIRALAQNDAEAASVIMAAHVVKARQDLMDRVALHDQAAAAPSRKRA